MQHKRMLKRFKPAVGLGVASIGIGLGSSVVTQAGGSAAPLAKIGGYMPVMGTAIGGGIMMGTLLDVRDDMNKKMRSKRRR